MNEAIIYDAIRKETTVNKDEQAIVKVMQDKT